MDELSAAKRLSRAVSILAAIDSRRRMDGDPGVGSNIERTIIDYELRELEEEIACNPCALGDRLDPDAVRLRRR